MDDAAATALTPRTVPERVLPVPKTVSPQLQRSISTLAQTPIEVLQRSPQDEAQWRAMIAASNAMGRDRLAELLKRAPATIRETSLGGVTVREVTPAVVDPANAGRVLMHFHGGAYIIYGGEASVAEAVLGAAHAKTRVLSVDYRMPPDHPFPAAVDDAVAAWTGLIATHDPSRIGVFGTSAGGGLLLAMTLKLKALGLPLPAALAPSPPGADLAGESDSYRTNAGVDGVLPFYDGVLGGAARLYAGPAGLHDPLVSPVHGDFAGFPPSLLTTGTRDILLSDTVRVYRAMRKAAVEARIEIYEAMSHAEYTAAPDSPESASVFGDIAAWFDRWLAR